MVECAGLEIRCTVMPYRGFESHLLRQFASDHAIKTIAQATFFKSLSGDFLPKPWRRMVLRIDA